MDFDPISSKKRYLEKLAAAAGKGYGEDLSSTYGPKPAPAPEVAPEPAAPVDPLADLDPEMLERLASPQNIGDTRDIRTGELLTTTKVDPNRKDEYGQVMPTRLGEQYTAEGLRQFRASDPEWPDKLREIRRLSREEEK